MRPTALYASVKMPERQAYVRRARHWLANRGWRGLLDELWYRGQLLAEGKPIPGRENGNTAPHPFDVAYGVDTSGLVWGESLAGTSKGDAKYWATGYYGISPSAFTGALGRLQLDWSRFTFVDVGCGKGRAMLLALRFPFRRVVGIELSASLAAVAQENLRGFPAAWRQPDTPAEAFQGDATTFPIPHGPIVFFLYHPFAAPVMSLFLEHIQKAAETEQREIYVLYANPELESLMVACSGMTRLWKETYALTPEEGAADRFGSYGEVFAAFMLQ